MGRCRDISSSPKLRFLLSLLVITASSSHVVRPATLVGINDDHVGQKNEGRERGSVGCDCVPDQWEGVLTSVEREFDMIEGQSDTLESSIYVHYDFTHEQFAMTYMTSGKRLVADYRKGKKYMISEHGCVEMYTDEPMKKMCLPEKSEFLGEYVLGTDIAVGMWQLVSLSNLTMRTTILLKNCIPITEEMYITKGAYTSLTNSLYLDVTLGIKDMSVFSAPNNCIPAVQENAEEGNEENDVDHNSVTWMLRITVSATAIMLLLAGIFCVVNASKNSIYFLLLANILISTFLSGMATTYIQLCLLVTFLSTTISYLLLQTWWYKRGDLGLTNHWVLIVVNIVIIWQCIATDIYVFNVPIRQEGFNISTISTNSTDVTVTPYFNVTTASLYV